MKFVLLKSRGGNYLVVAENVAWLRSAENGQTNVGIVGGQPLLVIGSIDEVAAKFLSSSGPEEEPVVEKSAAVDEPAAVDPAPMPVAAHVTQAPVAPELAAPQPVAPPPVVQAPAPVARLPGSEVAAPAQPDPSSPIREIVADRPAPPPPPEKPRPAPSQPLTLRERTAAAAAAAPRIKAGRQRMMGLME